MGVSAEAANRCSAPVTHLFQVVGRRALGHERCAVALSQRRYHKLTGAQGRSASCSLATAANGPSWRRGQSKALPGACRTGGVHVCALSQPYAYAYVAQGSEGRRSRGAVPPSSERAFPRLGRAPSVAQARAPPASVHTGGVVAGAGGTRATPNAPALRSLFGLTRRSLSHS